MDPKPEDKPAMLREVIYFYYSGCYYENNKDRMHKRYQVGRGGWSWDVGISDLKYKGEPKLDLAVKVLTHRNFFLILRNPSQTFTNRLLQTKPYTPGTPTMTSMQHTGGADPCSNSGNTTD